MTDVNKALGSGRLILRTTDSSPFGRKPRMAIEILKLKDRIEIVPAETGNENDTLRQQNPLGKMPALVLPDGSAVFDSRIIMEFLDEMAGGGKLLPREGIERYRTLTQAALADGVMDAGILVVYEGRFRPAEMKVESWLGYQRDKIKRGLAAFEKAPPDANKSDIASIGLACALGYLDWRKQIDWQSAYPKLVEWQARFTAHEPSVTHTLPPDLR